MTSSEGDWHPGSFTKNFTWGSKENGLRQLHEAIKVGFADQEEDVPREVFRERVRAHGLINHIPVNFFLFNSVRNSVDCVIFDELAFQAIRSGHSDRFDKLALFAFNFSYVGRWTGAKKYQRRPALWAFDYIRRRVAAELDWDVRKVNANDIQKFVASSPLYKAKTNRKLATNLNYLYQVGQLNEFAGPGVDRWWVDALFLALDRLIEDRALEGHLTTEKQYPSLLLKSDFHIISGRRSLEKDLATKHLIALYIECGARDRFSLDSVRERTELKYPDLQQFFANDDRPQGAVHPTNPRILKSIPRACAMLAKYAGFSIIDADELDNFSPQDFIKRQTKIALERLREYQIEPTMSAEELLKLTRSR